MRAKLGGTGGIRILQLQNEKLACRTAFHTPSYLEKYALSALGYRWREAFPPLTDFIVFIPAVRNGLRHAMRRQCLNVIPAYRMQALKLLSAKQPRSARKTRHPQQDHTICGQGGVSDL
jgi:hypothetical protein